MIAKTRSLVPFFFAPSTLYLLFFLAAYNASAAIIWWDPNSTTSIGGNGTWDTTSLVWSPISAQTNSGALIAWNTNDAAGFCAGPGGSTSQGTFVITINSVITNAGFFNGSQNPGPCTVTFTNGGSGSFALASGAQAFSTFNSSIGNTIIGVPITGPGQPTLESSGQAYFNAANTYTGGTLLGFSGASFTGLLNFNNTASFSTGSVIQSNANGCALVAEGSTAITIPNPFIFEQAGASMNIVGNAAGITFSGPFTLNTTGISLGAGGSGNLVTVSGAISGSGQLNKFNASTLALTGANTYSGKTTISNGTLSVVSLNSVNGGSASSSLGHPTTAANGTISFGATTTAATLVYTGVGETSDRVINLAGTTGGATIENDGTGPIIFSSDFTATGNGAKTLTLQGSNTGTNTILGKIVNSTSATSVTKSGIGTWVLAGANTYTGNTTLNTGGLLDIANASALGTGTLTVSGNGFFDNVTGGPLNIANGITCSGGSPTFVGSANLTINGNALITGANRTLTVSANTLKLASAIGDSGQGRGLTKAGNGTLELAGVNTYGGGTLINAGSLILDSTASLANSSAIGMASGVSLDVSAIASFSLTPTNSLNSAATNSPATIIGGGSVSFGSRPINLAFAPTTFTGDLTHPSLWISNASLTLNGNSITVTNGGTSPLDLGTYMLAQVGDGTTGVINGLPSVFTTVKGAGLVAGDGASVTVSSGNIVLVVQPAATFNNLSASQSINYGTATIAVSGTVGGSGPVYPAQGETVIVTISGNAQTTTINDATGDFALVYNSSTVPATGSPFAITYSYPGNAQLSPAVDTSTTLTVSKDPLTVTANSQTKVYGQIVTVGAGNTNFTSNGLTNSETIGSVTIAISGNGAVSNATVAGSPYTITPSAATGGTFTAGNYAITYVTNLLTVTPATLSVLGNNASRAFGATNPVFTVTFTNFVNAQILATSDVGGSPLLTTSADTNSVVGSYDITNSIGTLTSSNYTFTFTDGTLTVTNAVSTNIVAGSNNPALPATPVVITSTLSTLAPSKAVPTNSVQFVIDGSNFGPPVFPTNGVATVTNSTLSHGNHLVVAEYGGDTNAVGSTNILGSTNSFTQLINTPPIAGSASYGRPRDTALHILVSDLMTNATDPDGDAVSFVSVSATSTNGATISTNTGVITYTPPGVNGNVTDTFTYTVADSFGATNAGTVTITILPDDNGPSVNITGLATLPDGTAEISFAGIPGRNYLVQATTDLTPPITWATLSTVQAGTNGLFQFNDINSTNFTTRYYRTAVP